MSLNTESTEVTKTLIPVKNVSGRPWKTVQSHRTTGMIKNNNAKIGWKKRQAQLKNDLIFKQMKSELLTEQEQEKARIKIELEANRKRKEENEKRAEVVQQISMAKLKRMKKKQLRNLKKK